jgi:deoxyribodipyrimidine photo-lyase
VIPPERVRRLNRAPAGRGDFVLYWMQAAQRARSNPALEYAAARANELGKPLVVFFGLTDKFPEANARHYAFMLEGLAETAAGLEKRGIRLVVRRTSPGVGAAGLGRRASLVVVDRGHLRVEQKWRREAARALDRPLIEVESNLVVPAETASDHEEYSAATFRPKIRREMERFLALPPRTRLKRDSLGLRFESLDPRDPVRLAACLKLDGFPGPGTVGGGISHALARLDDFVENRLDDYPEARNDPAFDAQSHLSPYLHFGQISPAEVALRVRDHGGPGSAAFLEELLVRRELAFNFVLRNPRYDAYDGLPEWSRATLAKHARVPRPYAYALEDLEGARTHDPYWNAAQTEMAVTGRMHGYMRMYWGKKILEWSAGPEDAFRTALRLNNKYEIDGRDPNAFAGVAWCFGKHDRPWPERPVFGTVRYMNEAGLRRKFDADAYVRRIAGLARA